MTTANALTDKLSQSLLARRGTILVLITIVSFLSGTYALYNARINSDLNTLIQPSSSLQWFQDNEYFKQQFPVFEQTALLVVSGHRPAAVTSVAKDLARSLRHDEFFQDVFATDVDGFIAEHRWYYLDEAQLKDWLRGVEFGYGTMLRLSDEASLTNFVFTLADHLSANRGLPLSSGLAALVAGIPEGDLSLTAYPPLVDPELEVHHQIIVVKAQQNLSERLPNAEIVARLNQVVDELTFPADISVRLTGEVPLAHEEISAALDGIEVAGLISMLLLAVILGFGIRSLGFVLSIFIVLILGITLTLGLSVALVGAFNTISLIFIVMFFGLGVDFAVHFGLRIREAAESDGFAGGFKTALIDIGPALALCMLTSSIAFLSFLPTAYIGFGELGLMSALGMVVALTLTLTLLPLLLSYLDSSGSKLKTSAGKTQEPSAGHWLGRLPAGPVVAVFLGLTIAAGWVARDLKFDYSVLAMRDADTEAMGALLDLQASGVTTDYSIAVLANSEVVAGLADRMESLAAVGNVLGPEALIPAELTKKQGLVAIWSERFEEITEVFIAPTDGDSVANLTGALAYLTEVVRFAEPADQIRIAELNAYLEKLTVEEIAQINQALYSELNTSLADVKSLLSAQPFTPAELPDALKQRFITSNNEFLLRVQPAETLADREATTHFINEVAKVAPNIAGRAVVEWGIGSVVVESFQQATFIAGLCILILLTIYFRGATLPLLVLTPIVVTVVFTLAICQLFGIALNMANILVVPLIIGLGVDTGIHVVHRSVSAGSDVMLSSSTAKAVVISGLTTIGTFFSLCFSPHLGAASVGLLLTVAISVLLVVTFLLLPALIRLLGIDSH